ncbi:diguanylate cyclase (GGDEF)-like protein [Brevibacillus fulvus]|uniref:histidine kinase n=1 Tax=Brevibacillus fulvus TaxID=1125967 RepID=A0A938XYV5_9BACL|nr:diguanylate cyclase (GGDEF)-like protein [Brevibacillus fulvus]
MKSIRNICVPSLCVILVISSLVLGSASNLVSLLCSAGLFAFSFLFEKRFPLLYKVRLLALVYFHWSLQLNWAMILYYILLVFSLREKQHYLKVMLTALLYLSLYTAIRLSYSPLSEYTLLVTLYDLISIMLFALIVQYIYRVELEKSRLLTENDLLVILDPLTGLLNYDGYIDCIQSLIRKQTRFLLVLLDLQNYKSVNNKSIQTGNETLAQIALVLKKHFPNAYGIARYAGDQFALLLPAGQGKEKMENLLLSKRLGFEVTFGIAQYPEESLTKEAIISTAEERLFQHKRAVWLKREEELFRSEKLKVVGELAAGMAHEIRNPLTTIKGFLQISAKSNYNIKPWFDVIMEEIMRMNELTAEFLQFSKPHISNLKPEPIVDCIRRVLSLTESEALARGHNIVLETPLSDSLLLMDRDKIVQVLLNLIRNAFEAMEAPGEVSIRTILADKDILIEIEDTGCGIAEEVLSKIFDPFYTTKESGTGLGLSICQKIIQDHGGSLHVRSIVNCGTVFSIRLPVCEQEPSPVYAAVGESR